MIPLSRLDYRAVLGRSVHCRLRLLYEKAKQRMGYVEDFVSHTGGEVNQAVND